MTRLNSFDLRDIEDWAAYDRLIQDRLGVDLLTLAAAAADRPADEVRRKLAGQKLAAVSRSDGQGVVGGFAESLAAIGRRLGLDGRAMDAPDQAGLDQAARWGADIVISADDHHFLARDARGRTADNNPATSRAFVAALECMAEGPLAGREVVVLGLGVIGLGAARRLAERGARPAVALVPNEFQSVLYGLREFFEYEMRSGLREIYSQSVLCNRINGRCRENMRFT